MVDKEKEDLLIKQVLVLLEIREEYNDIEYHKNRIARAEMRLATLKTKREEVEKLLKEKYGD